LQLLKDLLSNGYVTKEGENEKKIRADDIFQAFLEKMIDMDIKSIDTHFKSFMDTIFAGKIIPNDSWKFVIT